MSNINSSTSTPTGTRKGAANTLNDVLWVWLGTINCCASGRYDDFAAGSRVKPTLNENLIAASRKGSLDTTKLLIEAYGANVNHMNFHDESPIYVACQMGHETVVRYLLRECKNVLADVPDNMGETPLFKATRRNAISIVKLLVEHNRNGLTGGGVQHGETVAPVNVNQTNNWGDTCLIIASRYGYTELAKYLLEHGGADARVKNKCGETPLYLARQCQFKELEEILKANARREVVEAAKAKWRRCSSIRVGR